MPSAGGPACRRVAALLLVVALARVSGAPTPGGHGGEPVSASGRSASQIPKSYEPADAPYDQWAHEAEAAGTKVKAPKAPPPPPVTGADVKNYRTGREGDEVGMKIGTKELQAKSKLAKQGEQQAENDRQKERKSSQDKTAALDRKEFARKEAKHKADVKEAAKKPKTESKSDDQVVELAEANTRKLKRLYKANYGVGRISLQPPVETPGYGIDAKVLLKKSEPVQKEATQVPRAVFCKRARSGVAALCKSSNDVNDKCKAARNVLAKHCDVLKRVPTMEEAPNVFALVKAKAGKELAGNLANINIRTAKKIHLLNAELGKTKTADEKAAVEAKITKVKSAAAAKIVAKARRVQRRASNKMTKYLAAAQAPKARKNPFKGSAKVKKSTKIPKPTLESTEVKKAVKLAVKTDKNMKRLKKEEKEVKKMDTSKKAKAKKSKVFVKHGSKLHEHKTYYHKLGPTPEHIKQQAKKDMKTAATAAAQHKSDSKHKTAMDSHAEQVVDRAVKVAAPKVAALRHKKAVQKKLKNGKNLSANFASKDYSSDAVEAAKAFTRNTEKELHVKPSAAKARSTAEDAKATPKKLGSDQYSDIDADVALANKYLEKSKVQQQEQSSARDQQIEQARAQANVLQQEKEHPAAKAPPVTTTRGPPAVSANIFNSDDGTEHAEEQFANSFGVSLDTRLTLVPGLGANRELGEPQGLSNEGELARDFGVH